MQWTYQANRSSPADLARLFAATAFDEAREPEPESIIGGWEGTTYRGTFRLRDGMRKYILTGQDGNWTVQPGPVEGETPPKEDT